MTLVLENHRQRMLLAALMYDTYKAQKMANNPKALDWIKEKEFTHEEVKDFLDSVFRAI